MGWNNGYNVVWKDDCCLLQSAFLFLKEGKVYDLIVYVAVVVEKYGGLFKVELVLIKHLLIALFQDFKTLNIKN